MPVEKDNNLGRIYKALDTYLLTGDERAYNYLCSLDPDTVRPLLITKLKAFMMYHPRLACTLGKYFNDVRVINKLDYSISDWLKTLRQICVLNNIRSFSGFGVFQRRYEANKKRTILKEYLARTSEHAYSDSEIAFLAQLLTDDQIEKMETILKGKGEITEEAARQPQVSEVERFKASLMAEVTTRRICQACPLKNAPHVLFDTNVDNFVKPVDVAFIGVNPGKEEVEQNKPFVGRAGQLLRQKLRKLEQAGVKYLITNVIFGYTRNTSEIPDAARIAACCQYFLEKILNKFRPRYIMLLGEIPAKAFGFEVNKITKSIGLYRDKYIISIHPSACLRNNAMRPHFEAAFEVLESVLGLSTTINKDDITYVFNITPDLTLVDVKVVGNKFLYILVDRNGRKVYHHKPFLLTAYVKDADYFNCPIIEHESNLTPVAIHSMAELQNALHSLREQIKEMRRKVANKNSG